MFLIKHPTKGYACKTTSSGYTKDKSLATKFTMEEAQDERYENEEVIAQTK